MMLPEITVVVCTHNRVRLLEGCLDSLSRQEVDPRRYDVLVVDNGSTDGTADFLSRCCYDDIRLRWVNEPVLGLSYARNRGWLEANGTYVAYIDDDAIAAPDWISEIISFVERRPEIAMFGGPHVPFATDPVPSWFPPEYGTMDLGSEERALEIGREFVEGMNMAIRKDILADCGGFHPDLGMKGYKVSYGEETQLQITLRNCGFAVYYLPQMKVSHHLPGRKMRLGWLLKSAYASGRCSALTWNTQRTLGAHCAGLMYGCFYLLRTFFLRKGIPLRRKLYYALAPLVSECGAFMEYLFEPAQHRREKVGKIPEQ
jgi:GT2 family glycosyltransferase